MREKKAPLGGSTHLPGLVFAASLEQMEFLSPVDGCPTVVYPELAENVFGVCTHGVEGHHQLRSNFRAVQVGTKQPEHFQFTFREWLDQHLGDGRSAWSPARGCQELMDIVRDDPVFGGLFQQDRHRWAFVHKDADVALWLSQRECLLQ